jgi:L-rhamnose isomerase
MRGKMSPERGEENFKSAVEAYARFGVDAPAAEAAAAEIPLSLQCWQGDDVSGFERPASSPDGGIMATGGRPGKATSGPELRADMEAALALVPGRMKVNVHAMYAETGGAPVDRDELESRHFSAWISWAREKSLGLDFNPTFFSHPLSGQGGTLTNPDLGIRAFWVRHGERSRVIAAEMGRATGMPAVNDIWIPDGSKDFPADRLSPRLRLRDSLDAILDRKADPALLIDAVEPKLFGLGSEAYVAGSHDFYLAYAALKGIRLCLDMGHFHPTESVADKVSALLPFLPGILVHASRGMRWDSDHIVLRDDATQALFSEIGRAMAWDRVAIALDYFDASVNRVLAWAIGARAARASILASFLEPIEAMRDAEVSGRLGARLALMEEAKNLPLGAVWDHLCLARGVPRGADWITAAESYEAGVLGERAK